MEVEMEKSKEQPAKLYVLVERIRPGYVTVKCCKESGKGKWRRCPVWRTFSCKDSPCEGAKSRIPALREKLGG